MPHLSSSSILLSVSAIYRVWFHLFWMFLTYLAFGILWGAFSRANNLVSKEEITDLERFFYDLSRIWEYSLWYLCIILLAGCIIGFLPQGPARTKWTRALLAHQFIYFISDSVACWSTYILLQSSGFKAIAKFCQESKPADLPIGLARDVNDMCQETGGVIKYLLIGGIVVWKLVGLNICVLTLIWCKCTLRGEINARNKIEKEVQEGAGPIKLAGEDGLGVEQKV